MSTSNTDYGKYTKLFSIYFVGGTSGTYYRVGDEKTFGNAASSLIETAPEGKESAWSNFLSSGSYSAANGVLTLTSKDGEVEEFKYTIADGHLKLVSKGVDVTGGNETAANVTNVLNSILTMARKSEINTNVGITYTYKKLSLTDLISLFSKNEQ